MHLTRIRQLGSSPIPISFRLLVGVTACLCAAPTSVAQEETFPFQVLVAHERTPLRSGPGDDHYATDELRQGTELEVHQRVDGGWLGVRPPASSFSWVLQRDVETTAEPDVGEIVGTAAVSWIGSALDDVADHRWLIKLNRGEKVRLLGKERRRIVSQGKSDLYVKIAPPAGEFRWLHEDDVVRNQEELATIKDANVALADFRVALRGTPRADSASLKSAQAAEEEESRRDGFVSRSKGSLAARSSAGDENLLPSRERRRGDRNLSAPGNSAPTADVEEKLRKLEAELALIAAQPADAWNFTALRADAEELARGGHSTLERARVQLFLDKLAEFEGLKSRHALMSPKTAPPGATASSEATTQEPTDTSADPRFDGTGWLLPVHSTKQVAPPYALLDKDGNILQFVSPAPGLNLNRYLRKEIGVFGQKNPASTLDKPHLTAHRIVELDRHR